MIFNRRNLINMIIFLRHLNKFNIQAEFKIDF